VTRVSESVLLLWHVSTIRLHTFVPAGLAVAFLPPPLADVPVVDSSRCYFHGLDASQRSSHEQERTVDKFSIL